MPYIHTQSLVQYEITRSLFDTASRGHQITVPMQNVDTQHVLYMYCIISIAKEYILRIHTELILIMRAVCRNEAVVFY